MKLKTRRVYFIADSGNNLITNEDGTIGRDMILPTSFNPYASAQSLQYLQELELKEKQKRERARESRNAKNDAMRSVGMTRVRGNLGGIYWE